MTLLNLSIWSTNHLREWDRKERITHSTSSVHQQRKTSVTDYPFFFFFWSRHAVHGILVPWPRMEPVPSAVEAWSPNHRGVSLIILYVWISFFSISTVTASTWLQDFLSWNNPLNTVFHITGIWQWPINRTNYLKGRMRKSRF